MCKINIDICPGRFGNQLQQLSIACHYAFTENNYKEINLTNNWYNNIWYKDAAFLKSYTIPNTNKECCQCENMIEYICKKTKRKNMFFYPSGCHKPNITLYDQKLCIQKYVKPYVKNEYISVSSNPSLNVIHVRSGDLNLKNKLPDWFYDNLIKQFGTCTIVYGGCGAKVAAHLDSVTYLKKKYENDDNVILQSLKLVDDVNTLINAENMVISVGTFGVGIYMLSTTIKNIYSYNYKSIGLVPPGNDPNVKFIDISE
tara:strand:+ start:3665 stop:4435 length:771 start_codon:yes stop_codon:yes gene_type:complete